MSSLQFCFKCKQKKPVSEFHKDRWKPDGIQSNCKICRRDSNRRSYRNNPKKQYLINKGQRQRNRVLIMDYLATHPCVDCGEGNPVVLEFDHLRDKELAITEMINRPHSWQAIQAEIGKCEVRCANCHRIKTAKQFNWYRQLPR